MRVRQLDRPMHWALGYIDVQPAQRHHSRTHAHAYLYMFGQLAGAFESCDRPHGSLCAIHSVWTTEAHEYQVPVCSRSQNIPWVLVLTPRQDRMRCSASGLTFKASEGL